MSEHDTTMDQLVRQEEAIESLQMQLREAVESANRMKERAESAEDERDQFSARVEVLEGALELAYREGWRACYGAGWSINAVGENADWANSKSRKVLAAHQPKDATYTHSAHGERCQQCNAGRSRWRACALENCKLRHLDDKPSEPVCKHCGGAGRSPIQAGVSRRMKSCPRCQGSGREPVDASLSSE